MSEARRIAQEYSGAAAWVPIDRVKPPEGELVEVLFVDGVVERCSRSGRLFINERGNYRYVDPAFWRPTEAAS